MRRLANLLLLEERDTLAAPLHLVLKVASRGTSPRLVYRGGGGRDVLLGLDRHD